MVAPTSAAQHLLERRGPSDGEALPEFDPEGPGRLPDRVAFDAFGDRLRFMARASCTIALSIACERSSDTTSRTNMPSILRCVTGSIFR